MKLMMIYVVDFAILETKWPFNIMNMFKINGIMQYSFSIVIYAIELQKLSYILSNQMKDNDDIAHLEIIVIFI